MHIKAGKLKNFQLSRPDVAELLQLAYRIILVVLVNYFRCLNNGAIMRGCFQFVKILIILIILKSHSNGAIIYVDGSVFNINANDGASFVGFSGSEPTFPSSFSSNFLSVGGDEQGVGSSLQMTSVPFFSGGSEPVFQLFLDAQETANAGGANGNRELLIFTEISLFVSSSNSADVSLMTPVWSLNGGDVVHVNDATNPGGYTPTATPLGNGGDVSLNVPFSAFPSGTTSDDFLYLRVTQTSSDNGGDEWRLDANGTTLPSGTLLSSIAIPEPSIPTYLLLGCGVMCRRRRRQA